MKSMRNLYFSVLGLLAGLSSWAMVQSGFHAYDALTGANNFISNNILPVNYFMEGALVGLGLGMVLQMRVSLWYHHNLVLVLSKMFFGALLGMIVGLISFSFGYLLLLAKIEPLLIRISSWTILGLFFVVTTELFRMHSGFFWPRVTSGAIGGLFGGLIFELLLLYQMSGPDHLFGLILVGFSISFFIGINEDRVTSCALKVLTGPQEGQIFLLDQNKFYMGYGSHNDFILDGYLEVSNRHALIWKNNDDVYIDYFSPDNEVLVNYRTVDHPQSLKKGDIIKIGTALLQYYEI